MTRNPWYRIRRPIVPDDSCDICGWQLGLEPHYAAPPIDENALPTYHCAACHPIGHNWHYAGDSEQAPRDHSA